MTHSKKNPVFSFLFLMVTAICVTSIRFSLALECHTKSFSNSSYLLVHTLDGNVRLVNRQTGALKWSMLLEPALRVTYNGGPMLIVDPLEGRLYEYSTSVTEDVFNHLDHSIMGYVRRAPAYYKKYISFGSKTDFWMSIDLTTGEVYHSSGTNNVNQCPKPLKPPSPNTEDATMSEQYTDSVGLGQTQYNLLFRDPATGLARLNITYNTFASHTEPDLQNVDLQHIATTEPRLVTFKDKKLLWDLKLSSPVVGLYAISNATADNAMRTCHIVPVAKPSNPVASQDSPTSFTEVCSHSTSPPLPHTLRRVAFTTYAFDFGALHEWNSRQAFWESKFHESLNMSLCLLIDRTPTAALFALPCVAESSLQLRSIRRAPTELLLEGPRSELVLLPDPDSDLDEWSRGLLGLYELPWSQLHRWLDQNEMPLWARLSMWRQITDDSNSWPVIVPPDNPPGNISFLLNDTSSWLTRFQQTPVQSVTAGLLAVVVVMALSRALFPKFFQRNRRHNAEATTDGPDSGFLPAHFDIPDAEGWAGCSAQEAGQPEAIRFNVNHVLGHGANGTMVFAGTFGTHRTAVKRIVRQHQLEKHWRREHTILLHLQHPNLVRCFWTGSTANFHYLVMQHCSMSLADLLQVGSPDPFASYGLTPGLVVNQFLNAVAYLHRHRIVHRDLKPSNVLIVSNDQESHIVVGDFGLSRPLPTGRHELTNSFRPQLLLVPLRAKRSFDHTLRGSSVAYDKNAVFSEIPSGDQTSLGVTHGTLGWMAPELYDSSADRVTYAIDIFSCGLLAYHVFTSGGHPYDTQPVDVGLEPGNADGHNSTGSSKPAASSHSDHSNNPSSPFCNRLNRHHNRQLAIVQGHTPSFDALFQRCTELSTATLACHLIQSMLSPTPSKRPTAEEAVAHPVFWAPSKAIRFISELSDLLDTREDEIPDRSKPNTKSPSKKSNHVVQRRALLDDVERASPFVFNEHWFHRLEPEVVQDLLCTRGYQDTSLMDLLRAIRNKRNHFWHMNQHIRDLYGSTQDGMIAYWTTRFPVLLPLLYDLSRHHLRGVNAMAEFLPDGNDATVSRERDPSASRFWIDEKQSKAYPFFSQSTSPLSLISQWKRGEVLGSQSAHHHPDGSVPSSTTSVDPTADEDPFVLVQTSRRRNAKRARPPKRRVNRAALLSTAGSELL